MSVRAEMHFLLGVMGQHCHICDFRAGTIWKAVNSAYLLPCLLLSQGNCVNLFRDLPFTAICREGIEHATGLKNQLQICTYRSNRVREFQAEQMLWLCLLTSRLQNFLTADFFSGNHFSQEILASLLPIE